MSAFEPLSPLPETGRSFALQRRVELGDTSRTGRMRLDAVARFLQDIAMADVMAAGLDEPAWIVRRTRIDVERWPRYLEPVELRTYCWSMGKFAAERRTTILGEGGGAIDTLTLWVRLDPRSGRPTPLTEEFRALYATAVAGRCTEHELRHPAPPPDAMARPWPLRACDFDLRGHVNNAACWAAVEELRDERADADLPRTAEMEFRAAIAPGSRVELLNSRASPEHLWLTTGGRACVSATAG